MTETRSGLAGRREKEQPSSQTLSFAYGHIDKTSMHAWQTLIASPGPNEGHYETPQVKGMRQGIDAKVEHSDLWNFPRDF